MTDIILVTDSYFDGMRHHERGPFAIVVEGGRVQQILARDEASRYANGELSPGAPVTIQRVPFVMPGLVEGHCHLFLNGAELNVQARKDYLTAPVEEMLDTGRGNLGLNLAAGITLVRDAGDIHGINTRLKAEAAACDAAMPHVLSPGRALRKAGRYGGFMAVETTDPASIVNAIEELAPRADQLKVLLTGIIDFEKGTMKGGTQFDLEETRLIVRTARRLGLLTYAHCSGREGLDIALTAGIDSIEHGFFMERDLLERMAEAGTAWVPTVSPVWFQFERPELAGWKPATVAALDRILKNHFAHIAMASDMGVNIVAGSDAGSYGVPHGSGLIEELFFQRRAGMSMERVLASATSTPRRLWRLPPADIVEGNMADLVALEGSPFASIDYLRHPRLVVRRGRVIAVDTRGMAASPLRQEQA